MADITVMNVGNQMAPGDRLFSPLGLFFMEFAKNRQSVFVECVNTGVAVPIVSGLVGATNVKLTANTGLVADTIPSPTIVGPASAPIAGMDMQDNGQVVIYSINGIQDWVWTSAALFAQEAVVAAVTTESFDEEIVRNVPLESGFPGPLNNAKQPLAAEKTGTQG